MPVSPEHLAWILDQLALVEGVTARRMFGAAGLYRDGVFFGIVDDDVLYLKTGPSNVADYGARGMPAFQPFPGQASMSYFAVPDDVLEDPETLAEWAGRAIEAAAAAPKRKSRRPKSR